MKFEKFPTFAEMLQRRDVLHLQWVEPWPGRDGIGKETFAAVNHVASVDDCVAIERHNRFHQGLPWHGVSDEELLGDFMATHWATPVGYVVTSVAPGTVQWFIPHPGTLQPLQCDSFETAMDTWFEGFNIPVKVTGGVPEEFSESCRRVTEYLTRSRKQEPEPPKE